MYTSSDICAEVNLSLMSKIIKSPFRDDSRVCGAGREYSKAENLHIHRVFTAISLVGFQCMAQFKFFPARVNSICRQLGVQP